MLELIAVGVHVHALGADRVVLKIQPGIFGACDCIRCIPRTTRNIRHCAKVMSGAVCVKTAAVHTFARVRTCRLTEEGVFWDQRCSRAKSALV